MAAGTAIVVLKLVYSHTNELNGWSEPELLVVMGIQILLGGVIKMSIQPNMERVMEEVREGKLDFALTKPEDSQVLVSVREVRIWRAVDVLSGALVLAYGVSGLERSIDVGDAALFVAMLLVGALTIYCFWLCITTGLLDREHLEHHRALRRRLPDGSFPDLDLPGLAADRRHVPRADRVRDHRARRGGDVAARLVDDRARAGLRGCTVRVHALVVALRAAPLHGRFGVTEWKRLEPRDGLTLMRGYERPWWVGGGWALDLFLGSSTRDHEDLDLVVFRDDQRAVREHFAGWDLHVAHEGRLTPWAGERLEPPLHTLWARSDPKSPWELELLLMESSDGMWHYRRDPRVTLELSQVGLVRDGIPFLAPEVPLLYKSKAPRERDDADFAAVVHELDPMRRAWLADAIRSQDASHGWLEALVAK